MDPLLDQLGATVVWVSVFAPMLWAGLVMALDPPGFSSVLSGLTEVLHRFPRGFGARWRDPFMPLRPVAPMPWVDAWVRPAGFFLVALSLAGLREALR